MMGKSALVFGSNGYLGRNLVKLLNDDKDYDSLKCFDIHDHSFDSGLNYHSLDLRNTSALGEIDLKVDYIFLFSGLTGTWVGFDNFNDFIDINEKGLLVILEEIRRQESKAKVIFPSTRLVYKGNEKDFIKEEDEKEPKTIYAVNKLACEHILRIYESVFDIDFTVFRICIPYGNLVDGGQSYGTMKFFLDEAINKGRITLFGNGGQKRTFSHVEDICFSILEVIKNKHSNGNIFNIGGENMSLFELATLISNKYKSEIVCSDWPINALKIESGSTAFDSSKLDTLVKRNRIHTIKNWLKE